MDNQIANLPRLSEDQLAQRRWIFDVCFDQFQPQNPVELDLVRSLAELQWQIAQTASFEIDFIYDEMERLLNMKMKDGPPSREEAEALAYQAMFRSKEFAQVTRHENFLRRHASRVTKDLLALMSMREKLNSPNAPRRRNLSPVQ